MTSVRMQYQGYNKMIRKDTVDTYETFVGKVKRAAKNPQELPAQIILQYLDDDGELIDVINDQDLKDCFELVQKPKFCIRNYSTLSSNNTSSIISNIELPPSRSNSNKEPVIMAAQATSSPIQQNISRVDESGELPVSLKKQEIIKPLKCDYLNQIYRLFNPEMAGWLDGPEITEKDLQQNSQAAVKAIRYASKSLVNDIVKEFKIWDSKQQSMRS